MQGHLHLQPAPTKCRPYNLHDPAIYPANIRHSAIVGIMLVQRGNACALLRVYYRLVFAGYTLVERVFLEYVLLYRGLFQYSAVSITIHTTVYFRRWCNLNASIECICELIHLVKTRLYKTPPPYFIVLAFRYLWLHVAPSGGQMVAKSSHLAAEVRCLQCKYLKWFIRHTKSSHFDAWTPFSYSPLAYFM